MRIFWVIISVPIFFFFFFFLVVYSSCRTYDSEQYRGYERTGETSSETLATGLNILRLSQPATNPRLRGFADIKLGHAATRMVVESAGASTRLAMGQHNEGFCAHFYVPPLASQAFDESSCGAHSEHRFPAEGRMS